ncbi:MAG: hypothetical protein KDA81_12810 [Planctomycetaceae bacterium]|nr:hypothetical protein [Planctomycetaceae bacterium]
MTVALKLAVLDGLIMGADSRTTVLRGDGRMQVFDGVRKLFILHKDYPAALMSWGVNRIGSVGLEDLMADVRDRLEGRSTEHPEWKLDVRETTLADVAKRVTEFLFHDHFQSADTPPTQQQHLHLHFAGYSPGSRQAEHVEYRLDPEHIHGPESGKSQGVQVNYTGVYLARILSGMDTRFAGKLEDAGLDKRKLSELTSGLSSAVLGELLAPQMPLSEAAALVRCLINSEIVLSQLGPEPDSVGGDIQMIAIDRDGCREMRFMSHDFRVPPSLWKRR